MRKELLQEQEFELEKMRLTVEQELWREAGRAVADNDLDRLASIRDTLSGLNASVGSTTDNLTPHEKFLDKWRVGITGGLVLALFLIVGGIVIHKDIGGAAAPYVSLLSGLAGIALGWMFATSGNQNPSGRSGATAAPSVARTAGVPTTTDPDPSSDD